MTTEKQIFPKTLGRKHVNFGKNDRFKRAHGCSITTYECSFTPVRGHVSECYTQAPGLYFAAVVQVTRGGSMIGPMALPKYFLTDAERTQYIDKRVDELRGKALK